jgi:hypothetical protein
MKFQKPKTVKSHFRDVDDRSESRIETIPEEQSNVFSETVQEAEESVIESRDPEFEREIITL